MEVEQLRKEVKLQRQQVNWMSQNISFSEMNQSQLFLVCCSKTVFGSWRGEGGAVWVFVLGFFFSFFLQLLLKKGFGGAWELPADVGKSQEVKERARIS